MTRRRKPLSDEARAAHLRKQTEAEYAAVVAAIGTLGWRDLLTARQVARNDRARARRLALGWTFRPTAATRAAVGRHRRAGCLAELLGNTPVVDRPTFVSDVEHVQMTLDHERRSA